MTPPLPDPKLVGMHEAGAWFALVIAGIGWFYLFSSQAARRLKTFEPLARTILSALLLAGACGCQSQGQQGLPTTSMRIGSRTFELEIARTQNQLETGLMYRDSMPADHGMIFVFDHEQMLVFWMKDTHIPLDVIFADSDGKVVSVRQMKAYDETNISSEGLAEYAIELNLGAAAAAGVLPGDHLEIPASARAAPTTQTAP